MKPNVHSTIKDLLNEKLNKLEEYFNADVFCYYGALVDGLENQILSIVEELANDDKLGQPVTIEEKVARAEEIAGQLSDNSFWKSHSRPINVERLKELRLKVEDFSEDEELRLLVRDYYDLLSDYVTSNKLPIFVNTRHFI